MKVQLCTLRKATMDDVWQVYDLYKIVARVNRGHLTQEEDEITIDYIKEMLRKGLERGLIFVLEEVNNSKFKIQNSKLKTFQTGI